MSSLRRGLLRELRQPGEEAERGKLPQVRAYVRRGSMATKRLSALENINSETTERRFIIGGADSPQDVIVTRLFCTAARRARPKF